MQHPLQVVFRSLVGKSKYISFIVLNYISDSSKQRLKNNVLPMKDRFEQRPSSSVHYHYTRTGEQRFHPNAIHTSHMLICEMKLYFKVLVQLICTLNQTV